MNYCPTCGQRIQESHTETGKLLRQAAASKQLSGADIARALRVSGQAVSFVLTGRQGSKPEPYLGEKSGLVYRIGGLLGVDRVELAIALDNDRRSKLKVLDGGKKTQVKKPKSRRAAGNRYFTLTPRQQAI